MAGNRGLRTTLFLAPVAALTARRASALILGWGALDEGENEASDGRFDGRGPASEKVCWRPVAPTLLLIPFPPGEG